MARRLRNAVIVVMSLLIVLLLVDFFGRELFTRYGVLAGSDYLSIYEIYTYKKLAKEGDTSVARRLAGYYGSWKNDTEKMMYWLKLAAERGDSDAEYEYGAWLIRRKKMDDEGLSWVKKSAAANNLRAKNFLRDYEAGQGHATDTN